MSGEYFARVAPGWDALRMGYFSDSVRDKAISISEAKAGALAADVGAGTGFMSEGLLARGLRVIAVDESGGMLREAERKLGGDGRIEFRTGTAGNLPIEGGTVDCVFANMLLHHVESPTGFFSEAHRVLKEGGRIVLTDLDEHGSVFLKTEHHDRWMGFSREAVRRWLEGAGFADARVTGLDESCCATSSSGEEAKVTIFAAVAEKPSHKLIK